MTLGRAQPAPVGENSGEVPLKVVPAMEVMLQIEAELAAFLRRPAHESGLRTGSPSPLTWDYVDLTGGYVEIASREDWTPKTQQSERHVPLSANLLAKIRSLPKEGP